MKPVHKKCFMRMLLFVAYGCAGAWLLSLVEKREESYAATSKRLLDSLRREMKNKYNLTNSTDFDKFVDIASQASQLKNKVDWTFSNACEFTFTAITTVGYGNITPQTPLGRGLTILYCVIGLPISMLALKTAGEVLVIFIHSLVMTLSKRTLDQKCRPKQNTFQCLVMIIVWKLVLICILATAGMYVDGWTFLEGLYSWFITFTTIGLGDFVPFQNFNNKNAEASAWFMFPFYLAFTIPYVVGLCLVSSLLNLLVEYSEAIKVHVHKASSCVKCSSPTNNVEVGGTESNGLRQQSFTNRRFSV